jgi:FkbH-like protein
MSVTLPDLPARLTLATMEDLERRIKNLDSQSARAWIEALDGGSSQSGTAVWLRALLTDKLGDSQTASAQLAGLGYQGGDVGAYLLLTRARFASVGDLGAAPPLLRQAIRSAGSLRVLRACERLVRQLRGSGQTGACRRMRIALEGSITLDFLAPVLRTLCWAAGIEAEIYVGPFNQFDQEILASDSPLARFQPDVVVVAMTADSLGLADSNDPAQVSVYRERFTRRWTECRQRLNAVVIQCNFEIPTHDPWGRLSSASPQGRGRFLRALNQALWQAADQHTGVVIFDLDQTAALYGKRRWADPVLWHAAKQYPSAEAMPFWARELTATLRAVAGLTAKCLVLDLDNTLWGGVIGEDGLDGIVLGGSPAGEAFVAFQKYVRSLSQRGILLAVCSKNNDADARRPFREHPEMILREKDIAVFVANWEPKDQNIRHIANTINIGLDSLAFVDDNPAERARIRQLLPEVEVIEMPADPALFIAAVDEAGLWAALGITEEDQQRTGSIQANIERQELAAGGASVDEYLIGLGMEVEIAPFDEANLPRIVQLINKTNQFNLTTRRTTEAEIRKVMATPDWYTQALRVRDRFGDSGLTGILMACRQGRCSHVHTWLMSCRVMGRRLEEMMHAALDRYARRQGFEAITGEYIPTAKNSVVADLYDRLGFTPEPAIAESGAGRRYHRPLGFTEPFPFPTVARCRDASV